MMNRFFLPSESFQGEEVIFPPETSHQIARVLRLRVGQVVAALDNCGLEADVELAEVEPRSVRGIIRVRRAAPAEPKVKLFLYLCLSQREKFEMMLQKCTELGAATFVPVISSRSLVQEKAGEQKLERWQRILQEAAEQCGRGHIPELKPILSWTQAVSTAATHPLALAAWEQEQTFKLGQVLEAHREISSIAIMIGPEGGFSEDEIGFARQTGIQSVSLGGRILRMETAAIAVTTLVMNAFGEM